jgi:N-acetylmuramoyl-L-alanine amidase
MADVPTVLVELGNMRNAGDARCMTSAACRDRHARGLTRGIAAHLMR